MFLVTALYGDGSTRSHLADTMVDALKWQTTLSGDCWEVFINPLTKPLDIASGGLQS